VGKLGGMWIAYLKDGLNNQVVKTEVKYNAFHMCT